MAHLFKSLSYSYLVSSLKKSFFKPTLLIGLLCCLATGCAQSESSHSVAQRLQLSLSANPDILNPILSTDAASSSVSDLIFNGLFKVNEKLELEPDLIDRYEISKTPHTPSGLTYTFHLKKGVLWHDGTPFTADDVKFTFETILDPKTNTVRRSKYIIDGEPIQIKVIDPLTFTVSIKKPFAPFLVSMAMGILPKHLLENTDINTTPFNHHPIGTGPFKFERWESGQYVLLKKNQHYHFGEPKLDEILFKIIPDSNTALIALLKGEVDMGGVLAKDKEKVDQVKHLDLYKINDLVYSYIGLNLNNTHLKDTRVRQAIAHAINKNAIVDNVYKGFATPAHIPASPVHWAYPTGKPLPIFDYDPEKSRRLLKEAGYTLNTKTGYFEKNNTPLELTILSSKGSKNSETMVQITQQYLKTVGIKLNIQLLEWQTFLKQLDHHEGPSAFDMCLLSWSLSIDPDAYSIWHSSQYPDGFNFIHYNNPVVDQKLVQARETLDMGRRKSLYYDIYTQIAQDVPYIFLIYPTSLTAVKQSVKGLSEPGPAGLLLNIENVYISNETH